MKIIEWLIFLPKITWAGSLGMISVPNIRHIPNEKVQCKKEILEKRVSDLKAIIKNRIWLAETRLNPKRAGFALLFPLRHKFPKAATSMLTLKD